MFAILRSALGVVFVVTFESALVVVVVVVVGKLIYRSSNAIHKQLDQFNFIYRNFGFYLGEGGSLVKTWVKMVGFNFKVFPTPGLSCLTRMSRKRLDFPWLSIFKKGYQNFRT